MPFTVTLHLIAHKKKDIRWIPLKKWTNKNRVTQCLYESTTFRATVSLRIEGNEAVAKLLKELTLRSLTADERELSRENKILLCLSSAFQPSTPKSRFFSFLFLMHITHYPTAWVSKSVRRIWRMGLLGINKSHRMNSEPNYGANGFIPKWEYWITNTAMTARSFFEKRTVYAEISECDEWLMQNICFLCKYFREVTTVLELPREKWRTSFNSINPLTPNNTYSGRTAPLTSKSCILYIYSTNIGTEYFKHGICSPFISLQNAVCFIIPTYLVPVLFTFCIQCVLKFKKIIPAPKG